MLEFRDRLPRARVVVAALALALLAGASLIVHRTTSPRLPRAVTVYLEDYCRCCERWAQHMIDNGYEVELRPVTTSRLREIRRTFGIPEDKAACHTALIADYVVEGHVPANVIEQVLRRKAEWRALAVPGMPHGSPGMEDDTPEPYDVLVKRETGTWEVLERMITRQP